MADKIMGTKKVSKTSTKQEMLEAYADLLKQVQEKERGELKPEEEIEKKKTKEIIELADTLSLEGVVKETGNLRSEIGKTLTQLSERLEEEVQRYKKVKEAVELKTKELQEIYEIEKAAQTLVVLIDAQSQKRQAFEIEMTNKKEELDREIEMLFAEQEKEKKFYEAAEKERDAEEMRKRQRDKEDYEYTFKREQQLARNKFEDEKAKIEKELQLKKETVEKLLLERERKVKEDEERLKGLQEKAANFSKEIEAAVQRAVKETNEKLQLEARNREELLKKSFEGEKNVSETKIDSLEKAVKEQREQIIRLTQQLEKAYQKVEDIAIKTVVGSSEVKSLLASQQWQSETAKKQMAQEK